MPQAAQNTKVRVVVAGENELVFYKVELTDNLDQIITTLEYSDITTFICALKMLNDELKVYNNHEELLQDFAQAKLNRFCDLGAGTDKIEELLAQFAKLRHQNQACEDTCIHCNPDFGTDPFPDFTYKLRDD